MDRLDYLNDLETVDLGYDRIRKNQERFKIKFVINSHIDYKDALRFMLPYSIQEIPNEDLMVVLGGAGQNTTMTKHGIEFKLVDNNSWDFHSLIYVVENPLEFKDYEYVFYMHDTCCPFRGFYDSVYNVNAGQSAYPMSDAYSSNIGLYKISHLMKNKDRLISLKNCSANTGISNEDFLLNQHKQNSYNKRITIYQKGVGDKIFHMGNNRNHDTVSSFRPNTFHPTKWKEGWKDVYHNGKYRRVIFWKNLNMAKFKSGNAYGGKR